MAVGERGGHWNSKGRVWRLCWLWLRWTCSSQLKGPPSLFFSSSRNHSFSNRQKLSHGHPTVCYYHWGNQLPRNGCYPPLGQDMSQSKPCFSAAGIKVQKQLPGNQYRAAKPLMNDSKRLIMLPKTAFLPCCLSGVRALTRIDWVPMRCGFQSAVTNIGKNSFLKIQILLGDWILCLL